METIKKILFPVDFSNSCRATARYVEAFAGHFDAEIMLLHVVGMGEHALEEELVPSRKAQLDAYLVDEFKYFDTNRVCETGSPAASIIDAATQWKPDLVMMPTHGMGSFQRFFLGSVTEKVLRGLACPIWTDAHLEAPPKLEDIHFRKVLCALDLGERSQQILGWAAWIAREFDACLGITHATDELWGREGERARQVREDVAHRIALLQQEIRASAQIFVHGGDPANVVMDATRKFGADLLVIGRHTGAGEYLRQHACSLLTDSPCPVISI